MRVKRFSAVWKWKRSDEIETRCDACDTAVRMFVRLDTDPCFAGVVNLCMPCARHVTKAVAALHKSDGGRTDD